MRNSAESQYSYLNIKTGMMVGFLASAVSLLALLIMASLALVPEFNFVIIQGSLFVLARTAFLAWMVYFVIGTIIWGPLYALLESRLAGETAIIKGLLFGMMLWAIIMTTFIPISGVDLFIEKFGIFSTFMILITDLIFGLAAAYFYNSFKFRN